MGVLQEEIVLAGVVAAEVDGEAVTMMTTTTHHHHTTRMTPGIPSLDMVLPKVGDRGSGRVPLVVLPLAGLLDNSATGVTIGATKVGGGVLAAAVEEGAAGTMVVKVAQGVRLGIASPAVPDTRALGLEALLGDKRAVSE
jgi:hypothetical protein